jgi:hypothetical protein
MIAACALYSRRFRRRCARDRAGQHYGLIRARRPAPEVRAEILASHAVTASLGMGHALLAAASAIGLSGAMGRLTRTPGAMPRDPARHVAGRRSRKRSRCMSSALGLV